MGHGLLRRWYRIRAEEAIQEAAAGPGAPPAAYVDGPPFVIVRLRPDHIMASRLNATFAALEFQSRAASRASGGNFLAMWTSSGGPGKFCSGAICPDGSRARREASLGRIPCYSNGRFSDQFAIGTPPTFDVYAAPLHPYSGDRCCEDYVTQVAFLRLVTGPSWFAMLTPSRLPVHLVCAGHCHAGAVLQVLPLANIVSVGAVASAGGHFGSVSMPGACEHNTGHWPLGLKSHPLWPQRGDRILVDRDTGLPVSSQTKNGRVELRRVTAAEAQAAADQAIAARVAARRARQSDGAEEGGGDDDDYNGGGGGGPFFLEYTHVPVPYGSARGGGRASPHAQAEWEAARAMEADPGLVWQDQLEFRRHFPKWSPVPGPFLADGPLTPGNATTRSHLRDPRLTTHYYVEIRPSNPKIENRAGLGFDALCAPLYSISNAGFEILRFRDAIGRARKVSAEVASAGACPPRLVPTATRRAKAPPPPPPLAQAQPPGLPHLPPEFMPLGLEELPRNHSVVGQRIQPCSDVRAGAAHSRPWIHAQLWPDGKPCTCAFSIVEVPDWGPDEGKGGDVS